MLIQKVIAINPLELYQFIPVLVALTLLFQGQLDVRSVKWNLYILVLLDEVHSKTKTYQQQQKSSCSEMLTLRFLPKLFK